MADTKEGRMKKARDAERRQQERDAETALERARDDDASDLVEPEPEESESDDS
jgi:hypothetical protein